MPWARRRVEHFDQLRQRGNLVPRRIDHRAPLLQRGARAWRNEAARADGRLKRRFRYEECADMRYAGQVLKDDPPSL